VSALAVRRADPERRRRAGLTRGAWVPLGLALAAFALAFAQSPGQDTADTKIDLHVDPVRFLSQLASVWSPTEGLGHVQGGQYSGYLWPMGPFFALGHLIGLPDWVTERLWLGMLLALAAWGTVRLVDALLERDRGVAHLVAGAVYMVNPYVVVFTSRDTVFLLAYAALPWLMLIAHRGLREPRRWWWPAAFALLTTSSGGGVNATVTALVLLGPVLLVLYEVLLRDATLRNAWSLAWRTALATGVSSAWWVVPLLVQSRYGLNFLQFTEQVGAIWATTSLTESLRLMGYWPSYLGVGYGSHLLPYYDDSAALLFDPVVVAASLLVPALALAGYVWTRRRRFGPFLLALAMVSLLVMSVGYPTGTLARSGVTFIYNHVTALQFLRTTYKAGPLLALALALLAGGAFVTLWRRLSGALRPVSLAIAAALLVLAALPLFQGRALELLYKRVPAAWTQAGHELDAQMPANSRAVVLPGQSYAYYTWGDTIDPILTATSGRPVAVRNVPPYDDLHAVDFLWTVDGLVQQQRLLPGQLGPLLDLMSARRVVTASDDNDAYSGAIPAAAAARELGTQAGLGAPAHAYGPVRNFPSPAQTADPPARLPQVRIYDTPARGLVRIEPAGPATLVDGSAPGIADIAALGALPRTQPLFYAGDESAATIRSQAQAGGDVFITDSNRRRVFVASRVRQNAGFTQAADQGFSPDAAFLNPFPARGTDAQTVAVLSGVRYIEAPYNPELAQFPEHSPYAAFDGDPDTSWQADPTLDPSNDWIQVGFDAPRNVPYVDLLPDQSDPLVRVTQVQIAGRTFELHPGWNRLALQLRDVTALRIMLTKLHNLGSNTGSAGGLAEVRVPGVHVSVALRPPVLAEQALRGADLRHTTLNYVFERTTADDPLQRGPAPAKVIVHGERLQAESALVAQAQDAETGIDRVIDPPAVRPWVVGGLATVTPTAPDPALDRLAGTVTSGSEFSSSGRLEGLPRYRASSAFDGSGTTAWVAPLGPYQPAWISWTTHHTERLTTFTLARIALPVRFPTRISVTAPGAAAETVPVGPGGSVTLPSPLTGRAFRIDIVAAAGSPRAAVGIASIGGAGIPRARASSVDAQIHGACGQSTAVIAGRSVPLRLSGSVATLNAGQPLTLSACGAPVTLPSASVELHVAQTVVRPLLISLRSPAPDPLASAAQPVTTGAVTDSGRQANGSYTGVRVHVSAPSWLVLGESYDRGWQATCNGHSLGPPRVIDAFANGWRVNPGCTDVSIVFGPQSEVDAGYIVGALACALLALVLLFRRPLAVPAAAPRDLRVSEGFQRLSPVRAIGVGVVCAAVFGFVFALRAGAVIGPAAALVLWRGLPARRAVLAAGALLVVVIPAVYLIFPGQNQGGYDLGYVSQHLGAHWVAVAALALLVLALARDLVTVARGPRVAGDTGRGREP
jgi:arabinofuranan 3-O-arabinosyltransferase